MKKLLMEFALFIAKASHVGKETTLASIIDNVLSKLDQQDAKKVTAKLCQVKVFAKTR